MTIVHQQKGNNSADENENKYANDDKDKTTMNAHECNGNVGNQMEKKMEMEMK